MKEFQCKDMGFDCDWTARGSEEDIVFKAGEHGKEKHGIKEISQDIIDKVKSKIREVKAA